jgi:carboxyl-terminal processing protease
MIRGKPGSNVTLEVLHPRDSFRREEIELPRGAPTGSAYDLRVEQGTAVLAITDLDRIEAEDLYEELDDVLTRGVDRLLLDLRNLAAGDPRHVDRIAALFTEGTLLRLRDRSGRLIDVVESGNETARWPGSLAVLVNGATAGAGEALAALAKSAEEGAIYGEATYGLGAEPRLYELESGYGLLVSAALWETAAGQSWNVEGVEPDEEVRAEGRDFDEAHAAQLSRVLDLLESQEDESPEVPAKAA